MIEAKITIVAPELTAAINNLASAIGGAKPVNPTATTQTTAAGPATTPAPAPTPAENVPAPAPVASTPPAAPAYPSNVTPMQPPAAPVQMPQAPVQQPAVPLATTPPQYTVDQIMAAGATLMDAGRVNDLMNLLHSFGVQAVTDLKPEQYGAFATALRNLGAKI